MRIVAIACLLALIASPPMRCQNHRVVKGPDAVAAPLGSNATFMCVVENAELRWTIDDLPISLDAEELWEQAALPVNGFFRGEFWSNSTITAATLLASASVHNNGTVFGCAAFGGFGHPLDFSPNVSLTVFGLPLAPGEVEVVGERVHQLRVTWIPPFSLPGEIISYSLLVTDEATEFTSSPRPLNDTSFTHQISERQALDCHLYSFSVFSLNDVGLSLNSSSSSTPALHPSVPGRMIIAKAAVLFTDSLTIQLQLQIPQICSPVSLTLVLESENSVPVRCSVDNSSGLSVTVTASECGVKENEKYSVTVLADNEFKLSSYSEPVTVYTTDVQWASAQELGNGSVLLKCGFAEGSTARGCQLTLHLSRSGKVKIVVQLQRRNDSHVIAEVYKGAVEWGVEPYLLAADIEEDGGTSGTEVEGNVHLIRSDTGVSTSAALPATPTVKAAPSNNSKGVAVVVIVMAVVAATALALVLTTLSIVIFIGIRSRKTRVVLSQPPTSHIYEDVDLVTSNPYLTHKLDTTADPAPSSDVGVGKPSGTYTFTTPATMGSEFDAYEVMKPSDSVKNSLLTTTENVCYTTTHHM